MSDTTLTTEDLAAIWSDDQHGEYIKVDPDSSLAVLMTPVGARDRIRPKHGSIWQGIVAWCDFNGFYPNVWSVNERGNVTLWSSRGESLGGLV